MCLGPARPQPLNLYLQTICSFTLQKKLHLTSDSDKRKKQGVKHFSFAAQFPHERHSAVAGPKFWGTKMFDFRQETVFLFRTPLLKAQNY